MSTSSGCLKWLNHSSIKNIRPMTILASTWVDFHLSQPFYFAALYIYIIKPLAFPVMQDNTFLQIFVSSLHKSNISSTQICVCNHHNWKVSLDPSHFLMLNIKSLSLDKLLCIGGRGLGTMKHVQEIGVIRVLLLPSSLI